MSYTPRARKFRIQRVSVTVHRPLSGNDQLNEDVIATALDNNPLTSLISESEKYSNQFYKLRHLEILEETISIFDRLVEQYLKFLYESNAQLPCLCHPAVTYFRER